MPGDELSFPLMKMCVFLWEDLENTEDLKGKRIALSPNTQSPGCGFTMVMSDAQSPGSVPWVDLTDANGQVPHYGDSRVIS